MIFRSDSITLIEDTRQKADKHRSIADYCRRNGIALERRKLDIGDYMLLGDTSISVDTKSGLTELCMDFGTEYARFTREMARAASQKVHLVILIEDGRFTDIASVAKWINPNYQKKTLCMSGRELMLRMHKAHISYGVEFVFCHKRNVGEALIRILTKKEVKS